jgi:hypothetical protein
VIDTTAKEQYNNIEELARKEGLEIKSFIAEGDPADQPARLLLNSMRILS